MAALLLAHEAGWEPAPLVLGAAGLALVLFWRGFLRLRGRGRADHAPWWRAAVFTAAVSLGVLAVVSPLDSIGEQDLVSAHMLQHVVIADLVPALLLVALQGPLLGFATPRPVLRGVARRGPLRSALGLLLLPPVAFACWAAAIGVWHVPGPYEAAVANPWWHDVEHMTFLLGGLLVWAQLVDPARRGSMGPTARVAYAVCLLAAGGALVNVLVFSGPLFPSYARLSDRPLGLSAAGDQQAAGLVMLAEQTLTIGVFVAVMLRRRGRAILFGTAEEAPARAEQHPLAL